MPCPRGWSLALLAAALALAPLAPAAQADLLVLNGGTGGTGTPAVFRFNATTGAALGRFGYDTEAYSAMTMTSPGEICVTSNILGRYEIYRFNPAGEFLGAIGAAPAGRFGGMLRGPDGNLYSTMQVSDNTFQPGPWRIVRHDRATPSVFIASGSGGMTAPVTMVLGADGNFYVGDRELGILRFNGTSGAFIDVFIPNGRGGLPHVTRMVFGPDRNLYISSDGSNAVYRYNGDSGAFVDAFVPPGSGGLSGAGGLAFGPDGHLYIVSRATRQVLRYHGATGAFMGVFAADPELRTPIDLVFAASGSEQVWFDDRLPAGAVPSGETWQWVTSNPTPFSGTAAHRGSWDPPYGFHEHWFNFASERMKPSTGDTVFAQVFLESDSGSPVEIMLSWCDATGWEHRAYWGDDLINAGQNGRASRRYMGPLPRAGGWARLEIPAAVLELEGRSVQGMAFTTQNVRATWDRIGISTHSSTPAGDTTAPVVAITAPDEGATVSGNLTITATGSDNVGVTRVEFLLDGGERTVLVDGPSSPYSTTWDTRGFSNGSHVIAVKARDAAGNHSSASRTINIQNTGDYTYPSVTIVSPADGSTVSGSVVVNAEASDNVAVQRVEFWISGTRFATDSTAPYSATWDSRTVSDANYTLVVYAYDPSGNVNGVTANIATKNFAPPAPPPAADGQEMVWVEDNLPAGAWGGTSGGDAWNWVSASPTPFSGSRAHQSNNIAGIHSHNFNGASARLAVEPGDQLMAYVYIDPANPPQEIMLSWMDGTSWEHRAYWGADVIPYGTPGTAGRFRAGELPAAGGWVRLQVSAAAVALEGREISGMSFTLSNGRVTWDRAGKIVAGASTPPPPGDTTSPSAFVWMEGAEPAGATTSTTGGDAWNWVTNTTPPSPSGLRVHQSSNLAGLHGHSFNFAWYPLTLAAGDSIFVYVLIDPANPPREIMLSWCDGTTWEHRAYWGADLINAGQNNTASRRYMGPIPATGEWVQLHIPASQVGLEGRGVEGMSFTLYDGRAWWDTVGKVSK